MKKLVYQINRLEKFYDKKRVLSVEGLEIFEGEIIGLSGRNGSGKSSLLRLLAFLETPSEGEIFYKGKHNPSLSLRREIGMMISEPCLLKRSVKANLLYGLKLRGLRYSQKDIFEILYLVGLEPKKFLHRSYHQLSNGEKQRVALASRLILSPKTLLLDEPTNSLDVEGLPKFSEAIKYAHQNFGATIVIASHDKDWLEGLMSREIGLHLGRLVDFRDRFYFLRHWERDERGDLYYDFGDNQRLFAKNTSHLGKKLGIALRRDLINLYYTPKKGTFYGKINSIKSSEDKVFIEICIGNEKIKKILESKDYVREKPLVNQEVWVEIGIEAKI